MENKQIKKSMLEFISVILAMPIKFGNININIADVTIENIGSISVRFIILLSSVGVFFDVL
ncbi:hypothetical protein [Providencia rettgeri]|uniref:hypothetical protein n=1 Tax=Providencia rettgeri TaxID=587 RepID=UPI001BA51573|nr:hypothetical protein [Providencia rettgeri]MBS0916726.1 hypothetical protein [Providencia rettgeri]